MPELNYIRRSSSYCYEKTKILKQSNQAVEYDVPAQRVLAHSMAIDGEAAKTGNDR
jgi:hypothetical protein